MGSLFHDKGKEKYAFLDDFSLEDYSTEDMLNLALGMELSAESVKRFEEKNKDKPSDILYSEIIEAYAQRCRLQAEHPDYDVLN
ncbi:hypothetical protein HOK51_09160 [Candidatus Woesearchaeota archaeon]|jgi:hypothetical protein|nr:hypothetical protein [Candidatus Woesearchaeota archaeon]MBT6519998.1 hypothetical protein [Candidatus Woesearchaeota archaeon]MBT7367755.1 hypothetical protein [Candidatus Woesearchaeota archaeon]